MRRMPASSPWLVRFTCAGLPPRCSAQRRMNSWSVVLFALAMAARRAESVPGVRWPNVDLPAGLLQLLCEPSYGQIATLMPDGSPHITQVWLDTDGRHILVNTVATHQKVRNV